MRPLLIIQNTCIHVLAVSIYHLYSFLFDPIIDSTTSSTTYARWWCEESFTVWWWCGMVIIIRHHVSYVPPVRVCMSHKMGQSAYWAWCCCWLLTGQDGVQCVCSGGAAGDFEFPFGVLLVVFASLEQTQCSDVKANPLMLAEVGPQGGEEIVEDSPPS